MVYCLQFTFKVLRPIVDTLETCYLMSTHSKRAIPYVDMFELATPYVDMFQTCYTLCQQIRNVLPYVDIFRTCYTLCRPVNILKQTLKVCRLNRPVQKVCTTNYIELILPPFLT